MSKLEKGLRRSSVFSLTGVIFQIRDQLWAVFSVPTEVIGRVELLLRAFLVPFTLWKWRGEREEEHRGREGTLEHKVDSYPLSYFSLSTCTNRVYCSFFECLLMLNQDRNPFFPAYGRGYIGSEWAKGREHSDLPCCKVTYHRPPKRRVALLGINPSIPAQCPFPHHDITLN